MGENIVNAGDAKRMLQDRTEGVITVAQLKSMRDVEVLDLVTKAAGHSNDFREYLHTEFSYTTATNELCRRGYENGWYRVQKDEITPEIYTMMPSGEPTKRLSFSVSASVAERWAPLTAHVPYKSVLIDTALTRLMDDIEAGLIEFRLRM